MNNGTDGTGNMKVTASITDSPRVLRRMPGSAAGSVTVAAPQPGQPPQLYTVVRNDQVDGNQSGSNISVHEGSVANHPNVIGTITIGNVPEQSHGIPQVPNGTPQRPTGIPEVPNHIPQRTPCHHIPSTFQIKVEKHGGKRYDFDVQSTNSVGDLMRQIEDRLDIPYEQQRLQFAGKNLNNDMTLSDCNIQKGSTVFLPLRLRGG